MKHISAILTTLLLALMASAQEISVQAPSTVNLGSNFTVRFVVGDQARAFNGPSFRGFSLISGPNTSTSSSMSFINGQTTRSVQTSFTYYLVADKEGTVTVDAATCTVGGKKISSKPFTVKVEKMNAQAQQQASQPSNQATRQQPVTQIDDNTLFARATISNSNPYQGEQVIITYKIYTQVQVSQFAIDKLPRNRGFWAEDLTDDRQVKQYSEAIGDRTYKVAEIRRGALFAQESGRLTIEPLDLNVLAMVQRQRQRTGSICDLFDDPFFNPQQAVERQLSTNRISVNVKPLPHSPEGFGGAVGRFDVSGGLNIDQVKADEAVTYRVTVSGSGNLMLIEAPSPQFPPEFEVYDPQIDDNIRKTDAGVSGSRTFEWVLIPRSQGDFTIPPLKFVYFDPATGQYVSREIPAQHIEVAKGDSRTAAVAKDNVRLLAGDINYLHPVGRLRPAGSGERCGWGFWLAAAMIVLAGLTAVIVVRHRRETEADIAGTKMKRAVRLAQKRLRKAGALLGTGEAGPFYEEIYKAIWGCLSDKYSIPLSQLNRETVSASLQRRQVSDQQMEAIMHVLQDVDMARFAPGDPSRQMQQTYDEALDMIANLV